MKFNTRRFTAITAVALAASFGLTACGGSDDSSSGDGGGSDKVTVTFLPKNLGNPYFDTSAKGGKAAVEEFGGTFAQVGPDAASPTRRSRSSTRPPSRA